MNTALTTSRTTELSPADTSQPSDLLTESPHDLLRLDDIVRGLQLLRKHRWRLALSVLLGLLVGAGYFVIVAPTYEAKAELLIEKRFALGIEGINAGLVYHHDDAGTHIAILKSPWFIGQVFESHGLGDLRMFAESRNPIESVKNALSIFPDNYEKNQNSESVVLNLTYQGPVAEECTIVLNALVESYKAQLDKTSRNENEEALHLVTEKAEQVQSQLNELEAEYAQFIQASPQIIIKDRNTQYYENKIANLEAEEASLQAERADLERRLAALAAATGEDGERRSALTLVPEAYKQESMHIVEDRYRALEDALLPLLLEERTLLRTLGPGHRKIRDLRDQITLTRETLAPSAANRRQLLAQTEVDQSVRWADPVQTYTEHLKQEYDDAVTRQQSVAERLEQARHQLQDYANYEHQERRFNREIDRSQLLYEGLAKQLHGIDLGKDTGGYSTMILAPASRALQAAPNMFRVAVFSAFFGLVFGGGWLIVAESSNNTFRNVAEIHQHLHAPIVGQVPRFSCNGKKHDSRLARPHSLDPIVCTHHQPLSVEAEAYRGIRTALLFKQGSQPQQVIQIASPAVGDGKSTLAANLAVSLAHSGKKVLLVDGDLRHPQVHKLFGQTVASGLSEVIRDEVEVHDAVHHTQIPGLALLPAGCATVNPADTFASPRFRELMDVLRENYDFVLIDTAALLAFTDAQAIAASVDGVILAIRPSKKELPSALRASEILQMVGAKLIGIVVNGTDDCEYAVYGERYHETTRYHRQSFATNGVAAPVTTEEAGSSASGNGRIQKS